MSKSLNSRARLAAAMLLAAGTAVSISAQAGDYGTDAKKKDEPSVQVTMFAPVKGDRVGIGGRGWFVDLAIVFDTTLEKTGFNGFQLTGPAGHNNVAPFPGTFSTGADEKLPGLIVLLSTTAGGAMSCQNIANLFNLTGVTNVTETEIELWDTWLVGAPNFGVNTESTIYVAMADDLNGDGIYNDAPSVVADANGDGICNKKDLKALGIVSNIAKAQFYINP
ncbi:MAG TPA: hypothetical protein VIM41_15170 [Gammaproteobacteria bacterium]